MWAHGCCVVLRKESKLTGNPTLAVENPFLTEVRASFSKHSLRMQENGGFRRGSSNPERVGACTTHLTASRSLKWLLRPGDALARISAYLKRKSASEQEAAYSSANLLTSRGGLAPPAFAMWELINKDPILNKNDHVVRM